MKGPNIDLRLWRQFVAVAEELHFGRAARRLHMTQPPLTQAIALLERQLDVRVFERSKRRVELTPAGAALLPEVHELLSRAARLASVARIAAAGESGHLRLAFVSTIGFTLLPAWVRAFRERYPAVQLELREATGDVQVEALARGELDGGLLLHSPAMAPPGLERLAVDREPLLVALAENHPLARRERLELAELLAEPLVIFPRRIAPSLHDAIFALYHAAGHVPQLAQEAVQMQTIVNLVSAGLGIAWVPASVRQFQRAGVVYHEVSAPRGRRRLRLPECETSLVWPADAGPTMLNFIALTKAHQRPAQSARVSAL
jgi:DNA-binding transcriptional LysR family regulator